MTPPWGMYRRKEIIMEERKDGITDNGSTLGSILIEKQISPELFAAFYAQVGSKHYNEEGHPDVFRVFTSHPTIQDAAASTSLRTTFAPGPGVGQLRCLLAGEVKILNMKGTPEDWQAFAEKLTVRNTALGLNVPEAKEGAAVILGHGEVFPSLRALSLCTSYQNATGPGFRFSLKHPGLFTRCGRR